MKIQIPVYWEFGSLCFLPAEDCTGGQRWPLANFSFSIFSGNIITADRIWVSPLNRQPLRDGTSLYFFFFHLFSTSLPLLYNPPCTSCSAPRVLLLLNIFPEIGFPFSLFHAHYYTKTIVYTEKVDWTFYTRSVITDHHINYILCPYACYVFQSLSQHAHTFVHVSDPHDTAVGSIIV